MTRNELKELIQECLLEEEINESTDLEMYEEVTILEEKTKTFFISSQGKEIRDKIKDIVYENTTRLGGFDKIKAKLFGANGLLNPNEVANVTKGLSGLFDNLWFSKPVSLYKSTLAYAYGLGTKGKYLYRFTISFTQSSSKMLRLTFNETIMDNKSFNSKNSAEIINFTIKNCSPDYMLFINKGAIESGKILSGRFESSQQNVKLYSALEKKFPDKVIYDDSTGKVRFSIKGEL